MTSMVSKIFLKYLVQKIDPFSIREKSLACYARQKEAQKPRFFL